MAELKCSLTQMIPLMPFTITAFCHVTLSHSLHEILIEKKRLKFRIEYSEKKVEHCPFYSYEAVLNRLIMLEQSIIKVKAMLKNRNKLGTCRLNCNCFRHIGLRNPLYCGNP